MHLKTRTWFLVSLFCFILAGYFWHLGNERYRRDFPATATNHEPAVTPIKELGANNFHHAPPPLLTAPGQSSTPGTAPSPAPSNETKAARSNPLLTNRLSNTSKGIKELMRSDSAVLLRNALIDTSGTDTLKIPDHLRADGDPGSYVIQANGMLDNAFRAKLKAAGASIVSYIPNNAYLVRVSEAGAAQMRAWPQTQSVLPWEPYYKLDLSLLALAVQNQPLPPEAKLSVLVFPGEREAGLEALKVLGAKILGEDRSPFGHEWVIQPPSDVLPALARLAIVESIQIHHPRQVVNDLTRPRLGVATNSTTAAPNYLGLTGQGVSVSVNDTGVDAGHPDLVGHVSGDTMASTIDYDGHGTHVAGTIAGSGMNSSTVMKVPQGSTNGFDFRGMAPMAKIFASLIDLITGPVISDTYLQEVAAANTNLISNNSWGYVDDFDYDFSAASFDAAVRNALPGQPGPNPVVFVFAAGNSGNGGADGLGGDSESIGSPATAKNVISVGALEKARGITNLVIGSDGKTNLGFFAQTDSDHQITSFSSRGNVGIGLEGPAGRFKPDMVAPGSFVISTRSANWTDPKPSGGVIVNRFRGEIVKAGKTNPYTIFIPGNASGFDIITRSNALSPNPFPALPIYAKAGVPTTTNDFVGTGRATIQPVAPGQWYYTIGNNSGQSVNYDLITVIYLQNTNSGNYFEVLSNLNSELAPLYRYESGTSQAAPAVSGILALMQEFFQTRLMLTNDQNIPALMKAMLINGARSVGQQYSLQVQNSINYQGWGVVNLSNSIPPAMNAGLGSEGTWPIAFFHTNTLYTGQSHTRQVTLNNFARAYPLRFTLVWTDPPGNPAASLKLVNDLDLIVSNNIATNEVYYGNNIPQGSDFNDVSDPTDTNAPPAWDVVNNVENVFINRPIPGTNYTVTVRARRVNVNAVTTQTNGVLQDYALVISCGNTLFTNAISVSDISVVPQSPDDTNRIVKELTNGVPLFHERVGANNPLIEVLNNGMTNQWNFYTFPITSTFTNTNLALITFLSANLAAPRYLDADIDLYVSTDARLLNLDTNVINDAINSVNGGRVARSRGGTETIIYTNVAQGDVYYVAVKAEDQQAGEFGILGLGFDDLGRDGNGNVRLVFTPFAGIDIPDGSPEFPQGANMFAIVVDPADVRRVVLTNTVTHENAGDLYGVLSHTGTGIPKSVVLNNHRSFTGTQTFLYDDATRNMLPDSIIPDGPGQLRDFQGEPAAGLWLFTMIDNSPYHTGRVENLIGYIEPNDKTNLNGVLLTAGPMQWSECLPIDVPLNATNVNIYLVQQPPSLLPVDLYILIGDCPDFVNYDKKMTIDQPGGVLSLSVIDSPGLQPGNRYYYAYYNPNSVDVSARLRVEFEYGLRPIASQTYYSPDTPKILPDDAVTNSFITVTNNRTVADVKVGLRLDHPRLSDTVVHLVSPQGTRILLTESRGGWTNTSYGFGQPVTFVYPFAANGTDVEFRTNIDTGQKSGVITINYDFFTVPDDLRVYYEGNRIYDSGYISGAGTVSINYGPGLSTVVTVVMNEGNGQSGTVWEETVTVTGPWNYTTFTDNPNLAGPIKFGVPPYYITPTNRTVLSNSFEGLSMMTNQTNFAQGDTFAGWTVMTNGVAVFTDTNHLYADPLLNSTNWGTNFLALSHGQVCLPLTTNIIVPDRDYVLNFIHRKVSSSPTQSVDLRFFYTADIFRDLSVSNQLSGIEDPPQLATKVRLCPGQGIVITAAAGQGAEGLTNKLFAGLPLYGLIGCFSLSQEILNSNTVAGAPFYIGTNAAMITAPTDPGDYYLFLGINNNDFNAPPTNNPTGLYTVTALWQHCQDAMSEVRLGANAIPIVGSPQWKVETVRFLANPTMTNLCLAPKLNTTMLFDSFQIDELVSTSYYQSDEPMTPFKGQLALGDWRLEVLDNRSGAILSGGMSGSTNDSGTLFSWSLNLIFADGPTAIPLTNGVIHTNVVRGGQIKYFIVAVPKEVTSASNIVFNLGPGNTGLELLYSPFGLPTGNSPPDPLTPVFDGFPIIANLVTPPGAELPVGRFYYLGVRNIDPTEVNTFTIQAEFNIPVRRLPNGFPGLINQKVAANPYSFQDIRLHTELAVTNMHYYYVDINSTNIVSMTISVFPFQNNLVPVNGDVNIVLRRALPVVDLFPRPTFFDYESTQPNFGNELILVNSNSLPVKLTPGRWYVGVYNTTNATANYDIVAQWSVAPLWSYVDLSNGVPQPFFVNSFDPLTNFYRFVVDQTNAAVLFEIYTNLDYSGDPDLFVKRADVPSPDLYEFSFLQARDSNFPFSWLPEKIALRTNAFLPGLSGTNMFIPGIDATNWFLQIVNPDPLGGTISGWVCAKLVDPISGLLYDCQDMNVVVSNNFNPGTPFSFGFNSVPGEYYAVEETSNFKTWTTAKTIQATKTKTAYTVPAAQTGPVHFYRIRHIRPPSR